MSELNTFGETRKLVLNVIDDIRKGKLSTEQGKVISQNISVINTNIQCEINYAKVALQAKEKGENFGRVVKLGTTIINGAAE